MKKKHIELRDRLKLIECDVRLQRVNGDAKYAVFPNSLQAVTILGPYRANLGRVKAILHPIDKKQSIDRQWIPILKDDLRVPHLYTPLFKMIIHEKDLNLFRYDKTETKLLVSPFTIKAIYILSTDGWVVTECSIPIPASSRTTQT